MSRQGRQNLKSGVSGQTLTRAFTSLRIYAGLTCATNSFNADLEESYGTAILHLALECKTGYSLSKALSALAS